MNIVQCETYTAKATVGLKRGYTDITIPKNEFKRCILEIQKELKQKMDVMLSVKLTDCEIVFLGQEERSVTIEFINYPKFPLSLIRWEKGVIFFIEKLMQNLEQNRVVIVFHDETLMIEKSHEIDPKILL